MNFFRKIKIALFAISFLLINVVYATSVSENDGSSFITKAEFDTLKNNFQSQLDAYNTSIDSKIDNAIASYLAGVIVKTISDENQICYDSEGILSPRESYQDLNFKEGILNWNFMWVAHSNTTGFKLAFTGKDGTTDDYYFNEMGIDDIYNDSAGYVSASWTGYVKDKQYLMQTADHWSMGEKWSGSIQKTQRVQWNCIGIPPYSNFRFNTASTSIRMFIISVCGNNSEPWGSWGFNAFHNTASRTVVKTTNTNIIITPYSVPCKRFSRLDDVYDFTNCEDPDITTFRKLTDSNTTSDLNEIFASVQMEWGGGNGTYAYQVPQPGGFKKGKSGGNKYYYLSDSGYSTTKPTNWDKKYSWQPYLGFCNYFSDYNQIYNKTYDGYVDDMLKKHPDLNCLRDETGAKHLALNAGSPIVSVTKDAEITFDVNFADTAQNYDVWFKMGSFSKNKNPDAETNLIDRSNISVDGAPATAGSAGGSIRINNGTGKVVIKAPSEGYLFIKWQFANTSVAGGGTYMPTSTVNVKSVN